MKFLFFGDPHFNAKGGSDTVLDNQLLIIDELLEASKDCDGVVCLGDWFDNRNSTNNKILQISYDIVKRFGSVAPFYIIVGNHDMYMKQSRKYYTPFIFESIINVNVITKPYNINDVITLLPWIIDSDPIDDILESIDTPYLAGHFEFKGATMQEKTKSKHGLKLSAVKKFKKVFSGHFHTPSVYKNVIYTGSMMAMSFAEANKKMGYYILDTDTDEYIFKPFTKQPLYMEYNITKENYMDVKSMEVPDNDPYIKLHFRDNIGEKGINKVFNYFKDKTNKPISSETHYTVKEIETTGEEGTQMVITVREFSDKWISENIPDSIKPLKDDIMNSVFAELEKRGL